MASLPPHARKLFHRVITQHGRWIPVTEIRRVPLFRWPWQRSPFVTIWELEHLKLFRDPT